MPSPTELHSQRAHHKDVRAVLVRDFSASRMSTTKWCELSECLAGLCVLITAKFVDRDEVLPVQTFWHVAGDWFDSGGSPGPFTGIEVEWMNIDPVEHVQQGLLLKPTATSHADRIERCLQAASIPYYWEGDCIRIIGHVRNQEA